MSSILFAFHERLSSAIIVFAAVCAVWGLWVFGRKQPVSSGYWGTLVIGEALMAIQGLIGIALMLTGMQPERMVHFLYGSLMMLSGPAVFSASQGRAGRREALAYGLVSLLIAALTARAMLTA